MSEMVDRGARILSAQGLDGCEEEGRIEPCRADICPCRRVARSIIAAMREPTRQMMGAGEEVPGDASAWVWRRMIEEALK